MAIWVVGICYGLVGFLFALPTAHVQAWRLGAWGVSLAIMAFHIAYERFQRNTAPAPAARRVALSVALGAFALAVSANIHSLVVPSGNRTSLRRLSLVIWPVMTGLPIFIMTFLLNLILVRYARRPRPS